MDDAKEIYHCCGPKKLMLCCCVNLRKGVLNWEDTARIDRIRRVHAQKHVTGGRNPGTVNSFKVGPVHTTRTMKSMVGCTSFTRICFFFQTMSHPFRYGKPVRTSCWSICKRLQS